MPPRTDARAAGREQFFGRLITRGRWKTCRAARGEGELVALAGQGERLQLTERQEAAQVVAAVERAQILDRAAALVAGGRGLVGDFGHRELVAQAGPARRGPVRPSPRLDNDECVRPG